MTSESKHYNVLFLCTGNSARSIIAEAIMNRLGRPRFTAYSAGSHPRPEPHPFALDILKVLNHSADGLRSKSWDEFAEPEAPKMDFVFTVCANAARRARQARPAGSSRFHRHDAQTEAAGSLTLPRRSTPDESDTPIRSWRTTSHPRAVSWPKASAPAFC